MFEGNGVNWDAYRLEKEEAKFMREDIEIAKRVVKVYRMMLHFYGMELLDERTGVTVTFVKIIVLGSVGRFGDDKIRIERYDNLNWSGGQN